jgi:molybdopterin-guanine dinucleotide biosynthesis protein A
MRQDKASLLYQGKNQLDRLHDLVARHVDKVFVSLRASQIADPARAGWPQIVDSVDGEGPIVGIRSALAAHSDAAWLVIACDLPFLSDVALAQLLTERDPTRLATAFVSTHDGLPEPLCAIWEPAAAAALATYQHTGRQCPRKFLLTHSVRLLEPRDRSALDNVNTPEEYREANLRLETLPTSRSTAPPSRSAAPTSSSTAPTSRPLKVQYFALLREQAGRSEEIVDTRAATPAALYDELTSRYRFTLGQEQLKVAVNSEFADWLRPLNAGDAVVFIPPVAGG